MLKFILIYFEFNFFRKKVRKSFILKIKKVFKIKKTLNTYIFYFNLILILF